jgi:aryl-alcohol dehydrogenase-like predicted oxidoreductase
LGTKGLSALQKDFLHAFFRREGRFFLTGGGALAGFHLGHRETDDLDLFTTEDAIQDGVATVRAVARDMGAETEPIHTTPDFRRILLRRGQEAVVIDLAREFVFQMVSDKPVLNGIRVDPPEEILANKLCALPSRSEIRDLVDVRALETAGYRVEDVWAAAEAKDRGLTPAQLAWVLSQIEMGDNVALPAGASPADLRQYLADLIKRLSSAAFPSRN